MTGGHAFEAAVVTIFPQIVEAYAGASVLGRARAAGVLRIEGVDVRAFARDRHRSTDDAPFGGGSGMVMLAEPLAGAIEEATRKVPGARRVLMTPQGRPFEQRDARRLADEGRVVLVCGRYEGVDERIRQGWIDEELSIGDYVITGGELAALVVLDAVARLVPGVLGNEASAAQETFSEGLLEYPQYTRPREFHGARVPDVLLSGDHGVIRRWRLAQSLVRTRERRPDLYARRALSQDDEKALEEFG